MPGSSLGTVIDRFLMLKLPDARLLKEPRVKLPTRSTSCSPVLTSDSNYLAGMVCSSSLKESLTYVLPMSFLRSEATEPVRLLSMTFISVDFFAY